MTTTLTVTTDTDADTIRSWWDAVPKNGIQFHVTVTDDQDQ
jgi:hypothetical protein